ncbi:hypothetical protein ABPG77_008719 [Micractinium sp. CCAP 211/92]
MDDPRLSSGFDLVVIYYGDSHNFSCPQCLHVFRRARTVKWQLLRRVLFSREWLDLLARHGPWKYVWLPDDDVRASSCDVAGLFAMMEAAQLQLAQMSVCRVGGTWVFWPTLFQRPGIALRFTPFVEIMAPAFDFSFFQAVVRPTLVHSFTGWGLDTIWPYLLGFPRDRIGVVDAVCMTHNGTAGKGLQASSSEGRSNYAAVARSSPHKSGQQEEHYVVHQLWNISRDDLWNTGAPSDTITRITYEWWNVPLVPKLPAGGGQVQQHAAAGLQQLPELHSRRMPMQDWQQLQAAAGPDLPGRAGASSIASIVAAMTLTVAAMLTRRRRRAAVKKRAGDQLILVKHVDRTASPP